MSRSKYDIFIPVGIVLILAMMIIPLPTPMLDFFMALNLMFGLGIILVVFYSEKTTDFTVFPTLLLLSTLFTLALNISSTRLIITQGASFNGRIIRAFSGFVTGGSGSRGLVVGFLVFIILIVVQVIVITKGAGRIAEVSARFTLEGMVQKNMYIDSLVSGGTITAEEGKARKEALEREIQFYSSMDGASKFVSGNVKAGIFITVIDVVGGLCVGTLMNKEPFGAACANYVALTIGDGLVSQIPALMVSAATALIVTRSNAAGSFTGDIVEQFSKDARVYWIVGAFLFLLGILPGFSRVWYIFMLLAGLNFYVGFRLNRKDETSEIRSAASEKSSETHKKKNDVPEQVPAVEPLILELGFGLTPLVSRDEQLLLDRIRKIRTAVARDLGYVIPEIRVKDNLVLAADEYSIKINGMESGRWKVRTKYFLAVDELGNASPVERLSYNECLDPVYGRRAYWIDSEDRDDVLDAGYTVTDIPAVISMHLEKVIRAGSAEILSRENVRQIIENAREKAPTVVDELMKKFSVGDVHHVLGNLLKEQVSIINIVQILQIVVDSSGETKDAGILTEKVRQGLKRQISMSCAGDDRVLHAMRISPETEEKLRSGMSGELTALFRDRISELGKNNDKTVVLCSPELRSAVAAMAEGQRIAVISLLEVSGDVRLSVDGQIDF
ncbi:MAG: flagellar biosynthesis protein FlhA [Spirochaetia bacterium]|nr:flagellar biosynthesis protein FlhA [Spirochaetia bacterium]